MYYFTMNLSKELNHGNYKNHASAAQEGHKSRN